MTFPQNLSEGFLHCASNSLAEIFEAPKEDFMKFLDMYTKPLLYIDEYYKDVDIKKNINMSLETVDFDVLADVIAKHFCKREWPIFGDDKEYKEEFFKELKQHAKDIGWKFLE